VIDRVRDDTAFVADRELARGSRLSRARASGPRYAAGRPVARMRHDVTVRFVAVAAARRRVCGGPQSLTKLYETRGRRASDDGAAGAAAGHATLHRPSGKRVPLAPARAYIRASRKRREKADSVGQDWSGRSMDPTSTAVRRAKEELAGSSVALAWLMRLGGPGVALLRPPLRRRRSCATRGGTSESDAPSDSVQYRSGPSPLPRGSDEFRFGAGVDEFSQTCTSELCSPRVTPGDVAVETARSQVRRIEERAAARRFHDVVEAVGAARASAQSDAAHAVLLEHYAAYRAPRRARITRITRHRPKILARGGDQVDGSCPHGRCRKNDHRTTSSGGGAVP